MSNTEIKKQGFLFLEHPAESPRKRTPETQDGNGPEKTPRPKTRTVVVVSVIITLYEWWWRWRWALQCGRSVIWSAGGRCR